MVCIGLSLCGVYWIEFGLKRRCLSLFPFSRALFYAIWEVKQTRRD